MYGEEAVDVNSVGRWVRSFKSGEKNIGYKPRSGRPTLEGTTEIKDKDNSLIRDDRPIITESCAPE